MNRMMTGKTCLVTGANSGIGKALSFALADRGAHVVMVCRDRNRGDAALNEIKSRTQNTCLDLLLIDLSSQRSIRSGVEEFKKKYKRLDVLINNAGALMQNRQGTKATLVNRPYDREMSGRLWEMSEQLAGLK
jgi:retinol dehydrogenase-14